MIRIGITGGIGSGKSMVCRLLSVLGVPIYNSDEEAKRLMCTNLTLKKEVISFLGEEAYKGDVLNKPYVAMRIFSSPNLLKKINEAIHPIVFADFSRWCKEKKENVVGIESALLYQSEFYKVLDRIIYLEAQEELRIERVMKRNNMTYKAVKERMEVQKNPIPFPENTTFILNDNNTPVLPQVLHFLQSLS
ncbi:MAG TPA: dephospho-CoA kinase [Porphyromonadaceae bacterium]|nr:dephospho-CoA kinase [Porphyromonadaceae bacterium]